MYTNGDGSDAAQAFINFSEPVDNREKKRA